MKTKLSALCFILISCIFLFSQCSDTGKDKNSLPKTSYGGFDSQIKWGEHLVTIGGCNDCHTPKKMTPQGPVPDESLMLSGHPEKMPAPDVDRKEMESKGLIVTQDLTAWVGPWGISYAANLTPDATGIGSWQESNFITALREGKFKGMTSARNLLPPMPWQLFKEMSDDEIKAIFAYLKSIKPVKNIVPQPEPPVSAPPGK
ncbi:MAG: c-type cytochrome [Ignavibacteria bacterium]|nr:c-type cytochrome [Ignavibacteria bacterium]